MINVAHAVKVGVHYEFECWSPMVVRPDCGLNIDVYDMEERRRVVIQCGPGGLLDISKKDYEKYLEGRFPVEIVEDSQLRWSDEFDNLVVTGGRNALLNDLLKGTAPSAGTTWYVGLKDTGAVAAADTMGSHAGWSELSAIYSEGTRPAFTAGTVASGSVDNSAAKASFSITSTDDVYGAFLVNESTKGGSSGLLYGAGDFSGARSVQNGDTLNVTVTCSITSS